MAFYQPAQQAVTVTTTPTAPSYGYPPTVITTTPTVPSYGYPPTVTTPTPTVTTTTPTVPSYGYPPTVTTTTPTVTTTTSTWGSSGWSTGLFDFFSDMDVCCFGLWCFPCMQCKTTGDFGWFCGLPLFDECCIVSTMLRSAMRERYNIPGSGFGDFCEVFFLYECAWCQMSRELKLRGDAWPGGMRPAGMRPVIAPTVVTTQVVRV